MNKWQKITLLIMALLISAIVIISPERSYVWDISHHGAKCSIRHIAYNWSKMIYGSIPVLLIGGISVLILKDRKKRL